jgi:hypothetical protein
MERTRWTDDLIDERMGSIDKKLDRLYEESQALRSELNREIGGVRAELVTFRNQVMWLLGGLTVSLVGLLGAAVIQA